MCIKKYLCDIFWCICIQCSYHALVSCMHWACVLVSTKLIQLSVLMSCGWVFLIMPVLWLFIIDFTHATVTDLNCVPIENFM